MPKISTYIGRQVNIASVTQESGRNVLVSKKPLFTLGEDVKVSSDTTKEVLAFNFQEGAANNNASDALTLALAKWEIPPAESVSAADKFHLAVLDKFGRVGRKYIGRQYKKRSNQITATQRLTGRIPIAQNDLVVLGSSASKSRRIIVDRVEKRKPAKPKAKKPKKVAAEKPKAKPKKVAAGGVKKAKVAAKKPAAKKVADKKPTAAKKKAAALKKAVKK